MDEEFGDSATKEELEALLSGKWNVFNRTVELFTVHGRLIHASKHSREYLPGILPACVK